MNKKELWKVFKETGVEDYLAYVRVKCEDSDQED